MTREQWAKLTNEEKRMKIAELCGWRPSQFLDDMFDSGRLQRVWSKPPDYLNDLNAMHKVEESLDFETAGSYDAWLKLIIGASYPWSATAAERAEAFVLTMTNGEANA